MTIIQDRLARYETVRREPSDIQNHLPHLVALVQQLDAKAVIELGVRFGVSTTAFLYALEQTGGHLWSVDVDNRFYVDDPLWTFVEGDDLDISVLRQLPAPVDVVFINTDHTYKRTSSEISVYWPYIRSAGALVLHGTNVTFFDHHPPGSELPYPVQRAVDEWTGDLLARGVSVKVERHTNHRGLTIVRVP